MAWNRNSQGVSPNRPRKRPNKTKKRLATKAAMLAAKKGKKK